MIQIKNKTKSYKLVIEKDEDKHGYPIDGLLDYINGYGDTNLYKPESRKREHSDQNSEQQFETKKVKK